MPLLFLLAACSPSDTTDPNQPDAASFVEDFASEAWIDATASSAAWDEPTASVGSFFNDPAATVVTPLGDPGDGSDGPFVAPEDAVLPAGSYQHTELTLADSIDVTGDLTLRVQGALRLELADLTVDGSLTIIAGGPIELVSSDIRVTGDLLVQQPGTVTRARADFGIALDDSTLRADGALGVDTRGSLSLNASDLEGRELRLQAERSITTVDSDVEANVPGVAALQIRAGHDLSITSASFVGAHETDLRVGGDLLVEDRAFVHGTAWVDVRVEGAATISDRSFVHCDHEAIPGCEVRFHAGSLAMADRSWINGADYSEVSGGPVFVEVEGDLTSADGWIAGGYGGGVPGGATHVTVGGDITLSVSGGIHGGFSEDPEVDGGPVYVQAGGTITVLDDAAIAGGDGVPMGPVSIEEGADVDVQVDAGVAGDALVVSVPLPLEIDAGVVTAGDHTATEIDGATVRVEISPDGSDAGFVPLADAVGATLAEGWRYRGWVPYRMFESARLEQLQVDYAAD